MPWAMLTKKLRGTTFTLWFATALGAPIVGIVAPRLAFSLVPVAPGKTVPLGRSLLTGMVSVVFRFLFFFGPGPHTYTCVGGSREHQGPTSGHPFSPGIHPHLCAVALQSRWPSGIRAPETEPVAVSVLPSARDRLSAIDRSAWLAFIWCDRP